MSWVRTPSGAPLSLRVLARPCATLRHRARSVPGPRGPGGAAPRRASCREVQGQDAGRSPLCSQVVWRSAPSHGAEPDRGGPRPHVRRGAPAGGRRCVVGGALSTCVGDRLAPRSARRRASTRDQGPVLCAGRGSLWGPASCARSRVVPQVPADRADYSVARTRPP